MKDKIVNLEDLLVLHKFNKQNYRDKKEIIPIETGGTGAQNIQDALVNLKAEPQFDVLSTSKGGTGSSSIPEARQNLGITHGEILPTAEPTTGEGSLFFMQDDHTPLSIVEGGTSASTTEEAITNLGINDYVIEQGIQEGTLWSYRKWYSGIAECWGTVTLNISNWKAWGSLYISDYSVNEDFPFTFKSTPVVNYTPKRAIKVDGWLAVATTPTATSVGQCYLVRPEKTTTTGDIDISVYAIGRWKA